MLDHYFRLWSILLSTTAFLPMASSQLCNMPCHQVWICEINFVLIFLQNLLIAITLLCICKTFYVICRQDLVAVSCVCTACPFWPLVLGIICGIWCVNTCGEHIVRGVCRNFCLLGPNHTTNFYRDLSTKSQLLGGSHYLGLYSQIYENCKIAWVTLIVAVGVATLHPLMSNYLHSQPKSVGLVWELLATGAQFLLSEPSKLLLWRWLCWQHHNHIIIILLLFIVSNKSFDPLVQAWQHWCVISHCQISKDWQSWSGLAVKIGIWLFGICWIFEVALVLACS